MRDKLIAAAKPGLVEAQLASGRRLQLLFPHDALLRDQCGKIFVAQSHLFSVWHLWDRQRLRCLSSLVVKLGSHFRSWQILLQKLAAADGSSAIRTVDLIRRP
jgi:hypothetical protein